MPQSDDPRTAARPAPVIDRIDTLWPVHHRAFARLLTVLRTSFDGDLDAMFVLLLVGVGTDHDDWARALLATAPPSARVRPTNASSIAAASGIPRETVRRKLAWLQDRGWIERDGARSWRATRSAAEDLRPATQATLDSWSTSPPASTTTSGRSTRSSAPSSTRISTSS
jgi:hypothetical protein